MLTLLLQRLLHTVGCPDAAVCQGAGRQCRGQGTAGPVSVAGAVLTQTRQTQLPPDYIELEKRVDALKKVHTTMLQVTYDTRSPSLCLV